MNETVVNPHSGRAYDLLRDQHHVSGRYLFRHDIRRHAFRMERSIDASDRLVVGGTTVSADDMYGSADRRTDFVQYCYQVKVNTLIIGTGTGISRTRYAVLSAALTPEFLRREVRTLFAVNSY